MKNALLSLLCAMTFVGCTSIESTAVDKNEISAHGEPVGIIQASALGVTALFHFIDIVPSDLDNVVNRLLVAEAKAMGANKVQLLHASTTRRHGAYALVGIPGINLISVVESTASGVAIK